ncbi:MAG: lipopolysaccharide heptosyltransferase I [Betaproteobacteria bacterium]|nr:lipopolysaccharide heptosyltransferase I [Betaproteobacteria bacterium]
MPVEKLLLVKTSSMGDVIHNLPVASDISIACPTAEIHWVAEEAFSAIPALHRAVKRVIAVAIRRWRKSFLARATRGEIGAFLDTLRVERYDAIIDTQGLLKSALIAFAAHGTRYGLDWKSSREPLAMFYDRTFRVPWTMHAVERNRMLAAQALGYPLPQKIDYGIRAELGEFPWLLHAPYAVLLHGTSAKRKLWPEKNWVELARHFRSRAVRCVLLRGGEEERRRSERIANGIPDAVVAPALALAEITGLLAGARAVIGVDTGLTHLAAALEVPTVGIYCATDPNATGIYGCEKAVNLGRIGAAPPVAEVIGALQTAAGVV